MHVVVLALVLVTLLRWSLVNVVLLSLSWSWLMQLCVCVYVCVVIAEYPCVLCFVRMSASCICWCSSSVCLIPFVLVFEQTPLFLLLLYCVVCSVRLFYVMIDVP